MTKMPALFIGPSLPCFDVGAKAELRRDATSAAPLPDSGPADQTNI
jgi:hypothetical protein